MLWVPIYHNDGGPVHPTLPVGFNLFGFATNASEAPPTNGTDPSFRYGQATSFQESEDTGASFRMADPASELIGKSNALVADARTISACMKLTYTGRLDRASGEVAFINNIPLREVLGPVDANSFQPLSVDELFRLAPNRQRLGIDTLECVYRPEAELSGLFHSSQDYALEYPPAETKTDVTVIGESARVREPRVFGFAWRGLDAGSSDLSFEFTKNIEWRPSATSGFVATVQRSSAGPGGQGYIASALTYLDKHMPGWQERTVDSAKTLVSKVAQAAFAGQLGSGFDVHALL